MIREIQENVDKAEKWVSGLDKNVSTNERKVSLISGAALMYSAKSSGSILTGLMAAYLLFRGSTGHCALIGKMEEKPEEKITTKKKK